MADTLDITQPAAETGKDIVTQVATTPALMFEDTVLATALFKQIKDEIDAHVPDLSTLKGRQEIAALAFKVSRTKTAIDGAGAAIIEDANKLVKLVNAQRKGFRDRLDAERDRARKPLDDWEELQKKREADARQLIENLKTAGLVALGDTAKSVRERFMLLKGTTLDEAYLGEFAIMARHALDTSRKSLETSYAMLVKQEADAAELKRLQDAETARKAEAAALEQANALWDAMVEEAETENRRIDARAQSAAETARVAADREAAKKIGDAQAETQRLQDAETQRVAAEAERLETQRLREADEMHRKDIIDAVTAALIATTGASKTTAAKIANSIAAGTIPHVKMEF